MVKLGRILSKNGFASSPIVLWGLKGRKYIEFKVKTGKDTSWYLHVGLKTINI